MEQDERVNWERKMLGNAKKSKGFVSEKGSSPTFAIRGDLGPESLSLRSFCQKVFTTGAGIVISGGLLGREFKAQLIQEKLMQFSALVWRFILNSRPSVAGMMVSSI